jgi:penicillin G amidase
MIPVRAAAERSRRRRGGESRRRMAILSSQRGGVTRGQALTRRAHVVMVVIWIISGSAFAGSNVTTESIILPSLRQPVEILVDHWAVPHIYARNESDLFFAQGFYVARLRLFQIDLWRRRGLGRLAEVFGPAYVEQDKAARLFLYRGDMKEEWASYSADTERMFRRFVSGINAYVEWTREHPEQLPFEFKLLHYKPARWSAEDAVRIRSHGYLYNLKSEVARAKVACLAGLEWDEFRSKLEPPWQTRIPDGLDPCLPKEVLKIYDLATQEARFTPDSMTINTNAQFDKLLARELAAEIPAESNNWVISAKKSATGHAILASDPHLDYTEPSVRYLVDLNSPSLHVIGANRPESPGVSFGHNDRIAFAYTSFPVDAEDLYVYELNPDNPLEYRYRGGWESARVLREEIKVKGQVAVPVQLMFTRHGPLIYIDKDKNRAFAVRSAWLAPGTAPYFPSAERMRARTFADYTRAVARWGTPSLNHVYADTGGNIGWAPRGFAPVRPNWDGLLPVPGDGRYEWAGRLAGDEFPTSYNPSSGYITTSNEMNLPPDYPYKERKVSFEWTYPYRHQRIDEVLSALDRVSIEDSIQLQNDVISIPARRLVALCQSLSSDDPKTKAALQILRGWNASVDIGSSAAALHQVWFSRHLGKAFKNAVLNRDAVGAFETPSVATMLDILERPAGRFANNPEQSRDELLLNTLHDAYEDLENLQGTDPTTWAWGKLHHSLIRHPFSELVDQATRAKLDIGPLERAGSEFTPNRSSYSTSDFRETLGPSVRVVIDLSNWDNSRAINYPGQSGDPNSSHYRDLASLWQRGQYFHLLYSRQAIEHATDTRVKLIPAPRPHEASTDSIVHGP